MNDSAEEQPKKKPSRRSAVLRVGGFIVAMASIAVVVSSVWGLPTPAEVEAWSDDYGWVAIALFLPVAVILKAVLFPSPLVSAVAGLIFGVWIGTLVVIASSVLAACLELAIGRYVAGPYIARVLPDKARRYDRFIERKGWIAVMYLRVIPAPHTLINYGAGCTSLRISHMALGTSIGCIPLSYAYVSLGGHLSDIVSPQGIGALVLIAVFAIIGVVLGRITIDPEDLEESASGSC